jgi:hypothetical protein
MLLQFGDVGLGKGDLVMGHEGIIGHWKAGGEMKSPASGGTRGGRT